MIRTELRMLQCEGMSYIGVKLLQMSDFMQTLRENIIFRVSEFRKASYILSLIGFSCFDDRLWFLVLRIQGNSKYTQADFNGEKQGVERSWMSRQMILLGWVGLGCPKDSSSESKWKLGPILSSMGSENRCHFLYQSAWGMLFSDMSQPMKKFKSLEFAMTLFPQFFSGGIRHGPSSAWPQFILVAT